MARKTLIKARLEEAALNYIKENGPASSIQIAADAKMNSGKRLKDARYGLTPLQVSQMLMINPKFKKVVGITINAAANRHRKATLWALAD